MNRIVVVGASAGGLAAAEALRRQGFDGEITLIGDERLAPYDRPPLSKQILDHRWQADQVALRSQADPSPRSPAQLPEAQWALPRQSSSSPQVVRQAPSPQT